MRKSTPVQASFADKGTPRFRFVGHYADDPTARVNDIFVAVHRSTQQVRPVQSCRPLSQAVGLTQPPQP